MKHRRLHAEIMRLAKKERANKALEEEKSKLNGVQKLTPSEFVKKWRK